MSHKVSVYVRQVRFVMGEESSDVSPIITLPLVDCQAFSLVCAEDPLVIYTSNLGFIVFNKNGDFMDFCRLKPESTGYKITNLWFDFPPLGEINLRDFVNAELSSKKEGFVDIELLNTGWALGNVPKSCLDIPEKFVIPERFLRDRKESKPLDEEINFLLK
jgi:hypothetical protein